MESTHHPHSENSKSENNLLVPGSVIVAGALIALAVIYSGKGFEVVKRPQPDAGTTVTQDAKNISGDGYSLGNPQAPVMVVEFSDFQCPFCGQFHKTTAQELINGYVKDGKVRFVYRHFPFLGQESIDAAVASECAGEQNKFWEYHDYLFGHQNGENKGAFARANLKEFAKAVGLDTIKFSSCLDTNKYLDKVNKDKDAGVAAGVNATPTNFVNGKAVQGAIDFPQFKQIIDAALVAAAK